jgi:hypothetical protein
MVAGLVFGAIGLRWFMTQVSGTSPLAVWSTGYHPLCYPSKGTLSGGRKYTRVTGVSHMPGDRGGAGVVAGIPFPPRVNIHYDVTTYGHFSDT